MSGSSPLSASAPDPAGPVPARWSLRRDAGAWPTSNCTDERTPPGKEQDPGGLVAGQERRLEGTPASLGCDCASPPRGCSGVRLGRWWRWHQSVWPVLPFPPSQALALPTADSHVALAQVAPTGQAKHQFAALHGAVTCHLPPGGNDCRQSAASRCGEGVEQRALCIAAGRGRTGGFSNTGNGAA